MKDKLWFFTAGRIQSQESGRTLVATNIPYTFTDETAALRRQRDVLGHGLSAPVPGATIIKIIQTQKNYTFNTAASMDLRSLGDRKLPESLATRQLQRRAVATSSSSKAATRRADSPSRTLARRVDGSHRRHAADRSGPRRPAVLVGHLLRRLRPGAAQQRRVLHEGVVLPLDEGQRLAQHVVRLRQLQRHARRQQPSVRAATTASSARRRSSCRAATSCRSSWATTRRSFSTTRFRRRARASNFRTHSAFFNDTWRVNGHLTANLGLRWDKNHGARPGRATVTANDSGWSPRVGVVWDPTGEGEWAVTGSFAKYVAAISNSIADGSSAAGNPQTYTWFYQGPNINAAGPVTDDRRRHPAGVRLVQRQRRHQPRTLRAQPRRFPG